MVSMHAVWRGYDQELVDPVADRARCVSDLRRRHQNKHRQSGMNMASQTCIDLAKILNRYWHPITTQKHIDAFCEKEKIDVDEVTIVHVGRFLLYFATQNVGTDQVRLRKYQKTISDLTIYINSAEAKTWKKKKGSS